MAAVRPLTQKLAELRATLRSQSPYLLAQHTGAVYHPPVDGEGELRLSLWDREVGVTYPGLVVGASSPGGEAREDVQALVLYHFLTADGTPLAGNWIGFSDLPNAAFYQQAYQGYTGASLASAFGDNEEAFVRAAVGLGGEPVAFADRAFAFPVLPQLALLAACWRGDEDFPASYKILLDASASHQLPTDVCAIVGGMLAGRLVKAGAGLARAKAGG